MKMYIKHTLFDKVIIPRWQYKSMLTFMLLLGVAAGSYLTTTKLIIPLIHAAGDTYVEWDFSSDESIAVGDSDQVEVVSDTAARLKVRSYADDENTALLYHFDESLGTSVSDSSSNGLDGVATAENWEEGNLNNAFHFNGSSDNITVSDNSAISFTQAHTLEAWTKLDTNFSAGSHFTDQPVVDKGDYRLYFDQNTGKLTYELASNAAPSWVQTGGSDVNDSWSFATHDAVKSVAGSSNSNIYVGLGGTGLTTLTPDDAEVWHYDGTSWTKVGGDGVNLSWDNGYDEVNALLLDGSILYAGLGNSAGEAEVWKLESGSWLKIADSAQLGSNLEIVMSLALYDDGGGADLYAGTGYSNDDGRVFRYEDGTWTQIGGRYADAGYTSWGDSDNVNYAYALVADENYLYAGLGGAVDEGELWRFDGTVGTDGEWEQIAGTGSEAGYPTAWGGSDDIEYVFALEVSGDYLYAGLGSNNNDGEVWRFDLTGETWQRIGGDGATTTGTWAAASDKESVQSLAVDANYLYAGLGSGNYDGEVWRFDLEAESWSQIGGDATGGWTNAQRARRVDAMEIIDGTLYSGLFNVTDNGQLWAWNGTDTWTQLGGDYLSKSWGYYGIDRVSAMTASGEYLYAGLGSTAGEAQVWEYDGSDWSIIGGQGVNSSWPADTIEGVFALTGSGGDLYAGLGNTTDDGQVWRYHNGSWVQIAGKNADSGYSGWGDADNVEYVYALAEDETYVYAGLGNGSNEGDVWRFHKADEGWEQIAGAGTVLSNGKWVSGYEEVDSLIVDSNYLYAGLGRSTTADSDVWRFDKATETWLQIGGDGKNSCWGSGYEGVYSMSFYQGDLYVGLGVGTDDAEVWRWDGTVWNIVGGQDNVNSSWDNNTYERVQSLVSYNGKLYAGLGTGADAETWVYDGSSWDQIAGDAEGGFDATFDEVHAMTVYEGDLYAGLGNGANADAEVWTYGNNKTILRSATSSFNTDWHHIAAVYTGTTMKIYIDGVLDNSLSVAQFINDSTNDLLIGSNFGSSEKGNAQAFFDGYIDEVRLSDTDRSSSLIAKPYATTAQTVQSATKVMSSGIKNWEDFIVTESGGGTFTYRLSNDGGSTWKYWDGNSWTTSASTAQANSQSVVDTNISTFPVVYDMGIVWQAILLGDGTQQASVSGVQITATSDGGDPSNPSLLTALSQSSGGTAITTGSTASYPTPYFSWSGASDTGGVGVYGYYVYFGTDINAEPTTAGALQTATNYTAPVLTNGQTYYLKIKTVDKAKNITDNSWPSTPFTYTYATSTPKPNNVDYILPASGTFGNIVDMNFSWPTQGAAAASPYDGGPDIVGWQYAINNTDTWLGTYTDEDLGMDYIPVGYTQPYELTVEEDGSYIVVGENTIYFRAVDADGNVAEAVAGIISYGGAAATFTTACNIPTGITVYPSTNSDNSFSLSWEAATPADGNNVEHYYYMINSTPPADLATIQDNSSAYIDNGTSTTVATGKLVGARKGSNTVYVVPVDDDDNYASSSCLKGVFTLDSTLPDPPANLDVSDVSIKATSLWRASVAWDEPEYTGTGSITYIVQRSTDGENWTTVTTTSGNAHVDTVSESQQYYWRVGSYDTSSESQNSPSYAAAVTLTPKGTFTQPASLASDPTVSGVTTKKATITWVTNRASDTKVQYGTAPGSYFDEEPSNSTQSASHTIALTNLSPGTTYYYRAKWTDEDGNTGVSEESTFSTDSAPTVTDPKVISVGLDSATISFTTSGASSAKIFYGETTAFGGVVTVATSTSEAGYTVTLIGLDDGTKYYYKINTFDSEDEEYEGNALTFETLPRPRITGVRVQQVKGTAQPTILVSWSTNTEVSSIVTYFPEGNSAGARDEVNVALTDGEHQMVVRGLLANTNYTIIVKGRDKLGNEAVSDSQRVTTATDTRPPAISNLKVEGSIQANTDGPSTAQLVVSWDTDEPSTSQVEYGEGTGTTYAQKSQEDSSLTFNHVVIISGLTPSKVYHLRALSIDDADNLGASIDTVTITPKASRSALDLVINNLSEAFGFLRGI